MLSVYKAAHHHLTQRKEGKKKKKPNCLKVYANMFVGCTPRFLLENFYTDQMKEIARKVKGNSLLQANFIIKKTE